MEIGEWTKENLKLKKTVTQKIENQSKYQKNVDQTNRTDLYSLTIESEKILLRPVEALA